MGLQLGLDTGGTYTDAVLVDDALNVLKSAKSLTTHRELIAGLRGAVQQVITAEQAERVSLVCLSTTLATNALVEGRGRSVALVLVGFNEAQLARANLNEALAGDPMLRVAGGHNASGQALCALDENSVRSFVASVDKQVDAYAISAVFAVRNPEHETQLQSIIEDMSGKPVTCGHHLSSGLDAPRRALTALLNARLIPMINALLNAAHALLEELRINAPLMVVKGDGSLISAQMASRYPVETILSGPAASVVGARFLCGEQEMLISDMGGTTTDVALIKGGQPCLSPDGATVGGWRTMVKAIDVRTYGLGGDSAVLFDRSSARMQLGPQRVMPLSLLAHQFPECLVALEEQLALPLSTTHSAQFVLVHSATPTDLSFQQQGLYEQIGRGPIAVQTLFQDQTLEHALRKLEQRGLVLRAGFTPTDASHVLGLQNTWPATAAFLGARLLMRYSEQNLGERFVNELEFAAKLNRQVSEQTAILLVDALSAHNGAQLNVSQRSLVERSFNQGGNAGFSLVPRLELPVAALGAPAITYYSATAELLDTRLLTSEFAHVANALGAVVGSIKQEQVIVISPAGGKRVSVLLPEGPTEFDTLDMGADAATARASQLAEEKAKQAGAKDCVLEVERIDNVVTQGDEQIFFESRITVCAMGRPAVS